MREKLRTVSRIFLALFFVLAGIAHFTAPRYYLRIMPPYVPLPLAAVYLSGFLEGALGIFFLLPRFRRAAAWGLNALLLAVFPANIHMALNPGAYPKIGRTLLWMRLPLQFVLIGWISWSSRKRIPAKPHRFWLPFSSVVGSNRRGRE